MLPFEKKIFDHFSIVFSFILRILALARNSVQFKLEMQVKNSNNKKFNSNIVLFHCVFVVAMQITRKENYRNKFNSFDDAGQTNPKSIDWLYVTHMLVVFVFWLSFLFYFPFAFTSKTKSIFKNYELLTIHRNPLSLSAYEKFKLNHRFLVKSNAY